MDERLAKEDWIGIGLRTLAERGVAGLKIGALSIALNVSRGSFYWHFRDIADFRAHLLQSWRERMTDNVIEALGAERNEQDRLKLLLQRAFSDRGGLDRAIRSWATTDADVAATVATADARRVTHIAAMLAEAGIRGDLAQDRAAFLDWAYLGQPAVIDAQHRSISPTALDDIAALFAQ